ncbi:HNH endonuclease [Pseudomonas aeruginosa]|nr:HNH endonuclease [Pseudomonas aeruginosa]
MGRNLQHGRVTIAGTGCQHHWNTQWHDHHILYRSQGGGDSLENRVLLHPACHQQLHARGLTVSKPAR